MLADRKYEDSRLKHTRVTHPTEPLERTYCSNCGKPKGWVSTDSWGTVPPQEVVIICDDCDIKLGRLPLPELHVKEFPFD